MSKIILSKSKNKGKRLKVEMINFDGIKDHSHSHSFGSDIGQTFIDHKDPIKRSNWIARHSVSKFWDNIHSPLFYSRILLWETSDFKKNIRILSKLLNTTVINRL
tara:strand:- start:42 stop:356 length:315 start_codon:yes stop_codon:yes gene_type:complete